MGKRYIAKGETIIVNFPEGNQFFMYLPGYILRVDLL